MSDLLDAELTVNLSAKKVKHMNKILLARSLERAD